MADVLSNDFPKKKPGHVIVRLVLARAHQKDRMTVVEAIPKGGRILQFIHDFSHQKAVILGDVHLQFALGIFRAVSARSEEPLKKQARNWTVFPEECVQCSPLLLRDARESPDVNVSI